MRDFIVMGVKNEPAHDVKVLTKMATKCCSFRALMTYRIAPNVCHFLISVRRGSWTVIHPMNVIPVKLVFMISAHGYRHLVSTRPNHELYVDLP